MAKEEDDKDPSEARSFPVMLANLGDGVAAAELGREFWNLVQKIRRDALSRGDAGESKGKLAVTFSIECNAKGEADIGWDVKVTEPKKSRLKAPAWVTRNGNISFTVPKQQELPLRAVSNKPADGESGESLTTASGESLPAT